MDSHQLGLNNDKYSYKETVLLIYFSFVFTIIFNAFFYAFILKIILFIFEFIIFPRFLSLEFNLIVFPLFIFIPMIIIYYKLKKYDLNQKLRSKKFLINFLLIFTSILIIYICSIFFMNHLFVYLYASSFFLLVYLLTIFPFVCGLLLVTIMIISYKLYRVKNINVSDRTKLNNQIIFPKYKFIILLIIPTIIMINPNGYIISTYIINKEFNLKCNNAKTIIYKSVKFDVIFVEKNSQNRYCKIDKYDIYSKKGSSAIVTSFYPKQIDAIIERSPFNQELKYIESENKIFDQKNMFGKKIDKVKSDFAFEYNKIFNSDNVQGYKAKIVNRNNYDVIAESVYYVSHRLQKVCGELIKYERENYKCLKPFNLVYDVLSNK